ncbi:coiled-coil domain-containing protein 183-like [Agelaius tricolor]|uniref:coiled-coil domain-containing protein 183-like n=1 Tax=Agelaius tricolor TaxID=9191 RepID=UPI0039F1D5E6
MVGQGMEAPGSTRGPKADLSQRSQEMRVLVGLQGAASGCSGTGAAQPPRPTRCHWLPDVPQSKALHPQLLQELAAQASKRCVIPRLTVTIFVPPCSQYNKLPIKDAFGEGQELVSGTESLEPAPRAKLSQTPSCQTNDNILEQHITVPNSTLGGVFWAASPSAASSLENGLMPIQVVIKKIEAKIHDQVKVCDMLVHQLKQWSQARDERQRHLQNLRDAETEPKWQEPELQTIRQLGNDIEKMLMKIHSGEIVTNLYLRLQEVLRRELVYLPRYMDLLSGMTVMYHEELTGRTTLQANNVIKKLMAEAGPRVRMEKQLRDQSLAEQRKHIESLRRQEESERQQRQQAVSMLSAEQDQSSSETLMGADVEAAMAKMQREAFVTDKMEKAKTALQCSCLWDIPSSIEAQRKSLGNLQQHIDECNERKNMLKKTLQNLESKQAKLKFNQPVSTTRCCWPHTLVPARPPPAFGAALGCPCTPVQLCDVSVAGSSMQEEQLRENLKQEEARLEQMRAHMLNNQKRLIEFENIVDNMFLRLQGISIPGKEDSGAVVGLEEKLQHCEQKLQFLKEQAAARPQDSTDEQSETFAKVRNLLEERTAGEKQNLRISFEDEDATEDGRRAQWGHVLQRLFQPCPLGAGSPCLSPTGPADTNPQIASRSCAHHTAAPDLYGKPQQHWRWVTVMPSPGPTGHPGMLGGKIHEDSPGSHEPNKTCQLSQGHGHSRGGLQTLPSPSSPLSPADTLDFEDEDHDYIPSREDIKKQGQQLIRMNTRRRKKK